MRIDGKVIAQKITAQLKTEVEKLNSKNIFPKLAIITLGQEDEWNTYIRQKIKLGNKLGITTELINLTRTSESELTNLIELLDRTESVHGIIVQRPIPEDIDRSRIINSISSKKDVDGFRIDSEFEVPVFLAVKKALEEVTREDIISWLKGKNVLILGKGETAGGPIERGFKKMGIQPNIADSKTENKDFLLKKADIVISCVGKKIINPENLKSGVILIGVGLYRGEDEKLHGDYDEQEIKNTASFYTPTPGGIGPINLAYLFENLINSAKI